MTAVESAIKEIEDALAVIQPQLEGLRDFDRLNIDPDTHALVQTAIVDFDRRVQHLLSSKATLEALMTDNYPEVPVREIPQNSYRDLKANVDTILAAFGKFTPNEAANLKIISDSPEPK